MTLHERMRAEEIMTRALICASPGQDLAEVETLLFEHRISGVPVVEEGHLVGVLSRSDIARVLVLMNSLDGVVTDRWHGYDQADGFQHTEQPEFQGFRQMVARLKVRDAMHDQVVTCFTDTPVVEVAELMIRQHIHRVIVVDGDRPVGIVSSLDVVRLVALPRPAADH
ncbi:MAG TPA: CBS domain-containing protein [Pirellulales bacterium]|jgi:CBS domain-containing protein|nr:CBS domain-containing protein [Pirellulales bacterium]